MLVSDQLTGTAFMLEVFDNSERLALTLKTNSYTDYLRLKEQIGNDRDSIKRHLNDRAYELILQKQTKRKANDLQYLYDTLDDDDKVLEYTAFYNIN